MMDFQELVKLLMRNKFKLLLFPVFSGILAFSLRFFLSERMYTSESQISTGLTIANDYMGDEGRLSPFKIAVSFENLIENMKSKMVVHRMAYKLLQNDLNSESPFRNPKFEELLKPKGDTLQLINDELKIAIDNYSLINKSGEIGGYIYDLLEEYEYNEKELLSNVHIYRIGSTDFINIRFTSERPSLSAFMVNLWADNFIDFYSYQNSKLLNESLSALSQILADKKNVLDQSTNKLNKYKSRYSLYDNEVENDPLAEYERLIIEKKSEVNSLNYRLQNVRTQIADMDNSSSYSGRKRIIGLKNELDRLNTRLIDNPKNQQLRDSINLLSNQLESEMYAHTSSSQGKKQLDNLFKEENELKISYEISLADLQTLQRQYSRQKGSALDIASSKSQLENLETEVQQARDEFIHAQDRFNNAKSHLVAGSSSVKLSYYGDVPEDPQSRMTIVFSVLGLIMGGVMTLFILLALELMDSRINNPIKFKRELEFTMDGSVENFAKINGDLRNLILGKHEGIKTEESKAFQRSLQKIRFEIQNYSNSTFLFTSTRESSGKSFILASLAYSMSLIQKKVLIIDTNFRSNELSKQLAKNVAEENTGMQALIANVDLRNELKKNWDFRSLIDNKIILPTQNPKISILKTNQYVKTPEEIFSIIGFGNILQNLKAHYDFIFMEGADLCRYSDSKELSNYTDYVVGVYSTMDEISSADKTQASFLKGKDDKYLMSILNKLRPEDVV